jgi:tetratricopeptide (TPR) repeat protein
MPHVTALALVVVAAVLAYANAPGGALVFDAQVLVAGNPVLAEASATNVWFALTNDYWQPMATDGLYRPLTILSYLVDRAVLGYGDQAFGYVIENIALHGACAVLVYALLWHLARRRWPATVAALVFAIHPITTEAVTNVVGRADLLAALGVLGGVLCWAKGHTAAGRRRVAWAIGLALSAVLALFSKESGLVLIAAVLLYDVAFPRSGRRLRAEHVVVDVVLVAYLLARWYVDRIGLPAEDIAPIDNPIAEAPFWTGRLTAIGVLVREVGLLVWPATLSVDYSYRQIPIVAWPPARASDWMAIAGLVALPLAVWRLLRSRIRTPAIFFMGGFAMLAALPSANLVRVIGSIMAERFLYLPLVGVAGVVALLADRWSTTPRRRIIASIVGAGIVLAGGVRTAIRNLDWRDQQTLWAATVLAAPDSAKAHKAYASALIGPDAEPEDLAPVVAQAEQAVSIRPDYQQALVDLGSYQIRLGDALAPKNPAAAQRWYEQAVGSLGTARLLDERATARFVEKMRARGHAPDSIPDVGDGILYNNLTLAFVKLGRLENALETAQRMRRLVPTNTTIYRDIAAIESAMNRPDDAAVTLFEAIAISDADVEAKQRLVELYRTLPAGDSPIVTEGSAGDIQIHTSHPIVRRHRCRAWRELVTIFVEARLPALADRARSEAASCE